MCVFKFSCACCFRYAISLLMTDLFTCNVCAISLPMAWLDSSSTFVSSPTYLLLHFGAQKLQFSTLDFWYCCIFTPGISWNYTLLGTEVCFMYFNSLSIDQQFSLLQCLDKSEHGVMILTIPTYYYIRD